MKKIVSFSPDNLLRRKKDLKRLYGKSRIIQIHGEEQQQQCILQHAVLSPKPSLKVLLSNLEVCSPQIQKILSKKLFMARVVRHWTRLLREVNDHLLEVTKVSLSNLI